MKIKLFLVMMMTSAFSFAQLSAVDYSDNNQKLSGYVGKPKKH